MTHTKYLILRIVYRIIHGTGVEKRLSNDIHRKTHSSKFNTRTFKSFAFYKEHPGLLQPIMDSLRSESEIKGIKTID